MAAVAITLASLLVTCVFCCVDEGRLSSARNNVVNDWFPHREAPGAGSYANCTTPLGAIAGPTVSLPPYPLSFYLKQPVVPATGLAFFGYNDLPPGGQGR
jgi:hypothetical protein